MFNDKDDILKIENFNYVIIDSKDDFIYVYNNELIVIFENFKKKIQNDYRKNLT